MKRVVIIGGGFAGSSVAKGLEKKFSVTLIDTKDYFEFTPGILRVLVSPSHKNKIQVLHKNYLKKAELIKGFVKSIDEKTVSVDDKRLDYDYLVICSGSSYNLPIKEENILIADRIDHLEKKFDEFLKSREIVIVGGGLVGVELAGEICTRYKEKEIIIVHSAGRLIERNPEKASRYAQRFLEKRGVKIIFNEFFNGKRGDKYTTDKKTEIKADLLFACTGIKANSGFMYENFKNALNKKNQIIVDKSLRVTGSRKIFAAGDVNDAPVEKTAQNSRIQAKTVIRNIIAMEENRELSEYQSKKNPIIVSLGKWKGIFVWKNLVLHGFLPGLIKRFVEFLSMTKYKRLL